MKFYTLLIINLFVVQSIFGQIYQGSSTALQGKIIDEETGEELIQANVQILKKGVFITGTSTDFDGNYKASLDPGVYDVIGSYIGLPDKKINGIIVTGGETTFLDIQMTSKGVRFHFGCGGVTDYKVPLIDKNNTTSGQTIISKTIQREGNRGVRNIAINVAGLSTY